MPVVALSPVTRLTAKKAVRSGGLWGCLFAVTVASSAAAYAGAYPTVADRQRLSAAFSSNPGISALFGPAHRLETVAGFTAWRSLGVLGIVGSIWGLLLATRLSRGEEESGRLELLLAGPTTRRRAGVDVLVGLMAGLGVTWSILTLVSVSVGRSRQIGFSVSASAYLSVCLIAAPAVMMSVGALASQLFASRRQANQWSSGFYGLAFVIRMVADSSRGLGWFRWCSPLGWLEESRPLTGSHWLDLMPIAGLVVVSAGATVWLAGWRDMGAGLVPTAGRAEPRLHLLSGVGGLTARLELPVAAVWVLVLGALGMLFGLVAQSAANALTASTTISKALARLGGDRGGAEAYLGLVFVMVAALLAAAAAGQVSSLRNEESNGYLDNLLVRPVERRRWMAGRLLAASGLVVLASVVAGAMSWVGAATQDSGVGFVALLDAGINDAAPAMFCLGLGALVFGLAPRLAPGVAYATVVWSFLVQLIGSVVKANRWLLDTSILHHISPAPAGPPNWFGFSWFIGVGLVAAAAGMLAFSRRDLALA